MKTNIDINAFNQVALIAKDIRFWLSDYNNPEKYSEVEDSFSSTILELGYQIKNGWYALSHYSKIDSAFSIFKQKYTEPSDTFLARHKATHFKPEQFLNHTTSQVYSILRRPYYLDNGEIKKELARETLPKVVNLIRCSFEAGESYLSTFHNATVGVKND